MVTSCLFPKSLSKNFFSSLFEVHFEFRRTLSIIAASLSEAEGSGKGKDSFYSSSFFNSYKSFGADSFIYKSGCSSSLFLGVKFLTLSFFLVSE